jgi:proteic killer suppression protein
MIRTFRHRGLKELFETGKTRRIGRQAQARARRQLDTLDQAHKPEAMNVPGWRFHTLRGHMARYNVAVTANYRLTFDWEDGDAYRVDYEDYH